MQQQHAGKTISPIKVLFVVVLNMAVLATSVLLGYEIYTNRYGLGLASLILALILLIPLALTVDLWFMSVIGVYISTNGRKMKSGAIPPTTITQEDFLTMLSNAQQVQDSHQTGGQISGRTDADNQTVGADVTKDVIKQHIRVLRCGYKRIQRYTAIYPYR